MADECAEKKKKKKKKKILICAYPGWALAFSHIWTAAFVRLEQFSFGRSDRPELAGRLETP